MRDRIFEWILEKCGVGEGEIIPWWGKALRALLFPIRTLRISLSYDKHCSHAGIRVNGCMFHWAFFNAWTKGPYPTPWIRAVKREGDVIYLESKKEDPSV